MKIKIFGFALLLGLATALGACESTEETPPATEATPAEPADGGGAATPTPTATP